MFQPLDHSLALRRAVAEMNLSSVDQISTNILSEYNFETLKNMINAQGPGSGKTALHRSFDAWKNNPENEACSKIVFHLIITGADFSIPDAQGVTPDSLSETLTPEQKNCVLKAKAIAHLTQKFGSNLFNGSHAPMTANEKAAVTADIAAMAVAAVEIQQTFRK